MHANELGALRFPDRHRSQHLLSVDIGARVEAKRLGVERVRRLCFTRRGLPGSVKTSVRPPSAIVFLSLKILIVEWVWRCEGAATALVGVLTWPAAKVPAEIPLVRSREWHVTDPVTPRCR